jgi:hypothetical protein
MQSALTINTRSLPTGRGGMSKADFARLAHLRYELRRFHRFNEALTHRWGVTTLQYQLMLQSKGYPAAGLGGCGRARRAAAGDAARPDVARVTL